MNDTMERYEPDNLSWSEQYKLLSGAVTPRPIALVTTAGPGGVNAAPFSFFNAVGVEPPMIVFSAGRRKGSHKDTIRNILENQEFVVHIVDVANAAKMNICAIDFEAGIDEIHKSGFATAASRKVRPPRLVDCPVQLECTLVQNLTVGRRNYDMIIGEVVCFHFRSGLVNERLHVDLNTLDPLGRLCGSDYTNVHGRINMPRLTRPEGGDQN